MSFGTFLIIPIFSKFHFYTANTEIIRSFMLMEHHQISYLACYFFRRTLLSIQFTSKFIYRRNGFSSFHVYFVMCVQHSVLYTPIFSSKTPSNFIRFARNQRWIFFFNLQQQFLNRNCKEKDSNGRLRKDLT